MFRLAQYKMMRRNTVAFAAKTLVFGRSNPIPQRTSGIPLTITQNTSEPGRIFGTMAVNHSGSMK
jgi:hypothetical protein